ncbi:hypothetical protein AMEX_G13135 [Astyanax mexicanus]|uniref:Uncharacterized protein n=1 Tax=Astyanax mexicanus TaxID=7994 RepID=A0A8T2LMS5_ASTMX|nr:hypothetical protein AMEX_G13135 [Astyanax mexicanus]
MFASDPAPGGSCTPGPGEGGVGPLPFCSVVRVRALIRVEIREDCGRREATDSHDTASTGRQRVRGFILGMSVSLSRFFSSV